MQKVVVVGAGLAGVEVTYLLIKHGIEVELYEQRPVFMTGAHHTAYFAELVCSNSLKSNNLDNACGLLKEEIRHLDSLTMKVAQDCLVPSGNALSVDRMKFAQMITKIILGNKLVHFHNEKYQKISKDDILVIATGPLSSQEIIEELEKLTGEKMFSFFDAASPIVEKDSIDFNKAYFKSRYNQGDNSYINCPMNKEEYLRFYDALTHAELVKLHEIDQHYFEGCLPIEVLAKRGIDTLRYGPLKPKGLGKTKDDHPYAVLQLRQDNVGASLYNLVGFQTNLTYGEQKRVFSMIPGLENVRFVRYGLMHRNTYICAPKHLNKDLTLKNAKNVYIAGQLSGVEGYVESAACGIYVGFQVLNRLKGITPSSLSVKTMLGSLINYLMVCNPKNFAPINANYGILQVENRCDKLQIATESLELINEWRKTYDE